jgi:hypothetical protein
VELKRPIVAVPVRLALVGREPVDAEIFVADVPRESKTQVLDDIAELLSEDATFLPVRFTTGVRLLAKHSLAWLAVQPQAAELAVELEFDDLPSEVVTLYDREHHVEVELVAGPLLRGAMFDSAPADRPRVIDHLNSASGFVRLWTEAEHYLVNKAHILAVSEVG